MKFNKINSLLFLALSVAITLIALAFHLKQTFPTQARAEDKVEEEYWMLLHRKSNMEFLYYGEAGNKENSSLIKEFNVMTGVPGEKPTPLPQLLGREYWNIVNKEDSSDNPETAPFFLTLDVPVTEFEPYGPVPYLECKGSLTAGINGQCNWELPGYFGLHGVSGDPSKITDSEGSSGCIRHSDEDITYLYNLLDPQEKNVRYYIEDK